MSPGELASRRYFYEINNKINAKNNISSCTSSLYKKYNKQRISMSSKYNRIPKISKNSRSSLLCCSSFSLFLMSSIFEGKSVCPSIYVITKIILLSFTIIRAINMTKRNISKFIQICRLYISRKRIKIILDCY